ncbi:MAG: hypothetical protein ACRYGA_08045 [Janthinobacterium lividum]
MTVICDNCQAVNRDKAMFCRGCARKLPAFVATAPAPLSTPAGAGAAGVAGGTRSKGATSATGDTSLRGNRSIPRWWFASILLLGAAAAALVGWIALTPGQTVALAPSAPSATSAAPTASAASPATVSSVVPFESALAPGESAIAVDAAPLPAVVQTPAARASTTARVQSRRSADDGRADPRAGCEHLFFAFAARCEANHCAEAAYTHHPRCDVVRAERQRDDARRDMTSGY